MRPGEEGRARALTSSVKRGEDRVPSTASPAPFEREGDRGCDLLPQALADHSLGPGLACCLFSQILVQTQPCPFVYLMAARFTFLVYKKMYF